jgi:hypothetical protein
MEEKKKNKSNSFKEKIKKAFRRIALAGMISASVLSPSYSVFIHSYVLPSEHLSEYKREVDLIKEGDLLVEQDPYRSYELYKNAMQSIKEKQDKIGEGKDIKLDFMRLYTVYAIAKVPPEPEYAEKYFLEAKDLAKKYSEIWKEELAFKDMYATILENLGFIYFNIAEKVRRGELSILLLKNSTYLPYGMVDRLVVGKKDVGYYSHIYPCKKIISSENFTEILYYYTIAKKYYEEYFKFYNENKKILEDSPKSIEFYKKENDRAYANLKTINDLLSKYNPNYKKESSEVKEEKKEIAEKKNNNNKQEVKKEEKKEESKKEEIDWKEIENKDIQEGL